MTELAKHSLERAKKFAMQALDGDIHMFLACQRIANETATLQNIPREITAVFDGIASEIDGLPVEKNDNTGMPIPFRTRR